MNQQREHMLLMFTAAVFIIVVMFLPRLTKAGSLEPTAPPGPTMKTLDEIPPTWSQKLDSTNGSTMFGREGCGSSRFQCIWYEGSPASIPQAVLDKETGLVWERVPSQDTGDWSHAYFGCLTKKVGGRYGWRLPTFEEICSLWEDNTIDHLPEGHPFQDIRERYYWSSTTNPSDTNAAMVLRFGESDFLPMPLFEKTAEGSCMWCVRGGKGQNG